MTLLFLELNEINFDQIRAYIQAGHLPNFAELVARHGVSETTSESEYAQLEPWIQWVTAHTGKTLAEHGVYRLGDIVEHEIDQIWEVLERQGMKVGAISPMNAKNRCVAPAFFMPDPWTKTEISGRPALSGLYAPIAQAVNDNAEARITPRSAVSLIAGLARFARPGNYLKYIGDVWRAASGRPWRKAILLDRLLADVFIKETRRAEPDFATLFLNAGAHIQHHYMFNSRVYNGTQRNPDWYLAKSLDPVLEVYALYDDILGQVQSAFPEARIMLATGLHQDPHAVLTLYWRLRDHVDFLQRAEVPFARVEPRMSRDFVVFCADAAQAESAEHRLRLITSLDGQPLFNIDNRGDSLFVEFAWSDNIEDNFRYLVAGELRDGLKDDVAFVAVKNGHHNGIGYFLDTGEGSATPLFALADIPSKVAAACGANWAVTENESERISFVSAAE